MTQPTAPPILPMPPGANPLLQFWRPSPPAGDAISGFGSFIANGNECRVPQYLIDNKFQNFAEKCPPDKFLNSKVPECSCASFHSSFDDFAIVMVKSGGTFFSGFGNGVLYPYLILCVFIVMLFVICISFVYYFSYRMSRSEIKEAQKPEFFLKWHKQKLSSLICLVLISFGFALFFVNFVGAGTSIKIGNVVELNTAFPGLVLALFGFLVWMKILSSGRQRTA